MSECCAAKSLILSDRYGTRCGFHLTLQENDLCEKQIQEKVLQMERTEVAVFWLHVEAIWFLWLIGNAIAGNKSIELGCGNAKPHEVLGR